VGVALVDAPQARHANRFAPVPERPCRAQHHAFGGRQLVGRIMTKLIGERRRAIGRPEVSEIRDRQERADRLAAALVRRLEHDPSKIRDLWEVRAGETVGIGGFAAKKNLLSSTVPTQQGWEKKMLSMKAGLQIHRTTHQASCIQRTRPAPPTASSAKKRFV